MRKPLKKITDDKEDNQFLSSTKMVQVYQRKTSSRHPVLFKRVVDGCVKSINEKCENKEMKKHIEKINFKIFSKDALVLSPRYSYLK